MALEKKLWNLMQPGQTTWTASDYTADALRDLPHIELYEYEQTYSQLLQSINYWAKKFSGGSGAKAYEGLYVANKTGNEYRLPYFSQYNHAISQQWQESTGPLGDIVKQIGEVAETVAKVLKPTAGIIYPKSWAGSNEASYEFSFDLLNTVHANDWLFNRNFLEMFIGQNLHFQENFLTITPPCLYEVLIPGVRWSPVAVISSIQILNKGTLNKRGGLIVPDAYGVTVTVQELINESRLIFYDGWESSSAKGNKIKVRAVETQSEAVEATQIAKELVNLLPGLNNPAPNPGGGR